MSYVSDHALYGLGVIQPAEWTKSGNVIKPKTSSAKGWFEYLQTQANRAAPRFKLNTITVDGKLGGNTLDLVQAVVGGFKTFTMPESLDEIAANAKEIGDDIRDNLKSKVMPPTPITLAKTTSSKKKKGKKAPVVDLAPAQQASLGGFPVKYLLIGGAAALVLWLTSRKSSASSAALAAPAIPKGV